MEEPPPKTEHPLYWVNVLRGRVEIGQLCRLRDLLSSRHESWIVEFINLKGLVGLFDVHENIFWRLYYHDLKGPGRTPEGSAADNELTFLACNQCLVSIFSLDAAVRTFLQGNRNQVHDALEQLILSLARKELESREKILWTILTILRHAALDYDGRGRLSELAHTLWEGLGSLQILLEEKNIYAPLVGIINDARGNRAPAIVGHVVSLITLALDGLHPDLVSYEHIHSRTKLRNGFLSADLNLALEKHELKSQASSDVDALEIYTAAVKNWNYCKTRDERYSEALSRRQTKTFVASRDLDTAMNNLDAYSYCEPTLSEEERLIRPLKRSGVSDQPPSIAAVPAPSNEPIESAEKNGSDKPDAYLDTTRIPPDAREKVESKADNPESSVGAAATADSKSEAKQLIKKKDEISIEERKKRRGMEDEEDDTMNNYKVDFGEQTSYVLCDDDFLQAEEQTKPRSLPGSKNRVIEAEDMYSLAMAEDERVWDHIEDGLILIPEKENKRSKEKKRNPEKQERSEGAGPKPVSAWSFITKDLQSTGNRRNEGKGFIGRRQLQQREDEQHEHIGVEINVGKRSTARVTLSAKPLPSSPLPPSSSPATSPSSSSAILECPDAYLDFIVSGNTAQSVLSRTPYRASTIGSSRSTTSAQTPTNPTLSSADSSTDQGPLYSVMRRQQLEVQQKRLQLDTLESQAKRDQTSPSDGNRASFRRPNFEATPHDLRSLPSIIKRGLMCVWSVQEGTDSKTGLPMPVSVFDPVFIIIDEVNMYIAPQRATEVDFPSRILLANVLRVREFRTASKDWIGKYGLTVEYMTGSASQAEKVTLVVHTKKSQQWWMKAIIMNKGLLRDWNEEFQQAMTAYRRELINQHASNMSESQKKRKGQGNEFLSTSIEGVSMMSIPLSARPAMQVVDLVKEFTEIAEVISQIIVDELHMPVEEKLIPPTQLGGMAGGEKYLSHGIFFKFAIDFRGLYNGDEFAMKATQHEIKGLTSYINYSLNSNFPNTLHFPIMSVIDYKGFRLSATSILPVGPTTIVYGSDDGSKTVHNKYKDMSALMKKAGRALNLKPHWITPLLPGGPKVLICGPGDIEGHLGTDGRFYVLDTARVFPPTTPTPELKGSFLYRLMRPEFVKLNPCPLCSDAYSRWAHDPDNPNVVKQHNAEIVEATNRLLNSVIPAFAQRMQAFFETIFIENMHAWQMVMDDMRVIVIDMHRAGINCRYMGIIRQHVTNTNLRKTLLIEMVSRVLKNKLRELMRNVRSSSEEENKAVIAEFFGSFLHSPQFWRPAVSDQDFDVKKRLQERFPSCLSPEEESSKWDLRAALHIGAVFARVNRLMGLNWNEAFESRLWRWIETPEEQTRDLASMEELQGYIVKISPTVAQLPLVSFFAAKKFEKYADSPYASTKKQLESFLLKARDQYLLALEMKSDDVSILHNLAALFARLARCIEEQMHDPKTMEKMRAVEGFDMKFFRHRAHRFYQSADRQYQEALRIDSTRADLLASYAFYLLTLPERIKEAEKYYTLAMQANPHNHELRSRYIRFHEELQQRNQPAPGALELISSRSLRASKSFRLARIRSTSGLQKKSTTGLLRLSSRRVAESDDIVISSPKTMNRKLSITLLEARGWNGRGGKDGGVSDTYCVLQLGQQTHRSTTKKRTSTPKWNETFTFTVTNAQEAVKLYAYYTGLFIDSCIGVRVLSIAEVEAMNGHAGWYVLCAEEGEPSDLALGEVRVHFQID